MEIPSKINLCSVINRFLLIFLPLAALVSGTVTAIYYIEITNTKAAIELNERYGLPLLAKSVTSDFKSAVSDLLILSEKNELQAMLRTDDSASRKAFAKELLSYAARKELYDQIRFLDETGMEVVRINFNRGEPYIVPEEQLQSKAGRYYFKDAFQLGRGEVFLSPLDLNIEHGEIEQPPKPMIRFGTPVFDIYRRKRGVMLLNYFGKRMLQNLEASYISSPGYLMLLNQEGFWLKGPKPEEEWGFMYKNKLHKTFGNRFPDAWKRIFAQESGQFYYEGGLFSFTTVFPYYAFWKPGRLHGNPDVKRRASSYYWKIVSHIPPNALNAIYRNALDKVILLNTVLLPLLAIFSWLLARSYVRRRIAEKALRLAQFSLDRSTDGIQWLGPKGQHLYVNDAFCLMLGYTREELLNLNISDIDPNIPPDIWKERWQSRKENGSSTFETLHRRKDGYIYPAEITSDYLDFDGKEYLCSSVRNIDERKKLEESLREKNSRITDSIQYARLIQRTLLPNPENMKQLFPDSFFIWAPRDIVGGDFIFTDHFEDQFIIAVIDCTGHGVPGAFMTLIAYFALKNIVRDEGHRDPAHILKRLNFMVKTALRQDTDYALSDDGLDAAVVKCSLPSAANGGQMIFAGAKLPLICISGEHIRVIKGDKQSIGYKRSDLNFNFTNHRVNIEAKMCCYMATDGFADQLGGRKEHRFGTKRFMNLLKENAELPFEKQREKLIRAFKEWQQLGGTEKQDDVTVVGFGF
jgi:PAS domain S-box-containing protein